MEQKTLSDRFYPVFYAFVRRAADIAVSLLLIILLSPLFIIAAVLIKIDSRGPVIFKHVRLGRDSRPFMFYKFRSMRRGAEKLKDSLRHLSEVDGPVFKIKNDPRITRIGRFLRRSTIDELPQLFNILKGDMTLIGPRPPLPEEVKKYSKREMKRLSVTPGATGLWQVSGRCEISFLEWMELDLYYIEHRSITLDFKILLRTIPAILSGKGAY
jgi:lipopolysaccharide/colanic/teichoic acid biosynthesis glycosyltransferase